MSQIPVKRVVSQYPCGFFGYGIEALIANITVKYSKNGYCRQPLFSRPDIIGDMADKQIRFRLLQQVGQFKGLEISNIDSKVFTILFLHQLLIIIWPK